MDGLLLINKEKDMTSRDVVNLVGKYLKTTKVGHTGTLDPNATGVLVLCIGKALKVVNLITAYDKTYIGEVILGVRTDTLDITGNILEKKEVLDLDKKDVTKVLKTFEGDIEQEVPLYSAIKIDGKRLYEYARANIPVKLPMKKVHIKSIKLDSDLVTKSKLMKFKIKCEVSKGTYIRSLIRDIGDKLGTIACMGDLTRIKQGKYKIEDCYSLKDVKSGKYELISMKEALSDYPMIKVDKEKEKKVLNGMVLDRFFESPICVILNDKDEVIGIYETYIKDNNKVKPMSIFN